MAILTPQKQNSIAKRLGLSKKVITSELFSCYQEIANLEERIAVLEEQLKNAAPRLIEALDKLTKDLGAPEWQQTKYPESYYRANELLNSLGVK